MLSFLLNTMDYSQAFWPKSRPFFGVFLLFAGRCYEVEVCASVLLVRCSLQMVSFFCHIKMFSFWPKTMDYSQAFWPKLRPFFVVFFLNSMEVARKIKLQSVILLLLTCPFR